MEKPFSTSKLVLFHSVEYFDPHDVFKLVEPNLLPRLPLRHLNWQSHSGPIRSIDTLHIDLVPFGSAAAIAATTVSSTSDDGFQTQSVSGSKPATASATSTAATTHDESSTRSSRGSFGPAARRHQIPGLRRTSYLKILFVRCDDNDVYKEKVRSEIKEWLKAHTPKDLDGKRKLSKQEGHDAFEWLVVHVVLPNTVAATQPRTTSKTGDSVNVENKTTVKWRGGSSTLLEKLRTDFNPGGKLVPDRIAQLRIGVNDVPYDLLPRVVPAVPSGYVETREDVDAAWGDFMNKLKNKILQSFDTRVHFYEEDIKEKDAQRAFAGWNFCTFFILKEGLARGFESVGLVEDALVGYDELSVGLDIVVKEQANSGTPSLLPWTPELRERAEVALGNSHSHSEDEEAVDLQSPVTEKKREYDDIPIHASKKPYRELILANNVSLFDFRCYIFARQIALLSRLGNAMSTREELLAKLHSQQEAIQPGVAPLIIMPQQKGDETENLAHLAEVCRRTLQFIPAVSAIMRADIIASFMSTNPGEAEKWQPEPRLLDVTENIVSAFAFATAQQILAQTSTTALPIPPPSTPNTPIINSKIVFPDPKAHLNKRNNNLTVNNPVNAAGRGKPSPISPGIFPGPAAQEAMQAIQAQAAKHQNKAGLDDLAARRAELYTLCRNVLEQLGKKKGWMNGWVAAPMVGSLNSSDDYDGLEDVDLSDNVSKSPTSLASPFADELTSVSINSSRLLATALDREEGFYKLYEMLTDKALRHYTISGYDSAVQTHMADLAVFKMHLGDYAAAAPYLQVSTEFFGDRGWSMVELSLLVQYSKCLRRLGRQEEFVKVGLRLLTKAAMCRFDTLRPGASTPSSTLSRPDLRAISGLVEELLATSKALATPQRIALIDFFYSAEISAPPEYLEGKDMFSLSLALKSLLTEAIPIESATFRLSSTVPGVQRTIVLQTAKDQGSILKPGTSLLKFTGSAAIPGHYKANHLILNAGKVQLIWDLASLQPSESDGLFKRPSITVFQRANAFDVDAAAASHTKLHTNNCVDITLSTGWNAVSSCEIVIRPASGGLRILTSEATLVTTGASFAKKPEAGHFKFSALEKQSKITFRFPFSIETDGTMTITLRLEASYSTADGTFSFARTRSIPVSLAVGVNVQDVFKHDALFSRFTVSSATPSPMRLFSSALKASEIYTAKSGFMASEEDPVVIFTKQPASVLYRISRTDKPFTSPSSATMSLHLSYALVRDEVSLVVQQSIRQAFFEAPAPLGEYSILMAEIAVAHTQTALSPYDLEKNTLLGSLPTSFLGAIDWPAQLAKLGGIPAGSEVVRELTAYVTSWLSSTPRLPMVPEADAGGKNPGCRSIEIPVDIPPLEMLITADIRVDTAAAAQDISLSPSPSDADIPTVCVNQMLPAILQLKWTRRWAAQAPNSSTAPMPVHYAYDVTAPPETWLIGGRKKGVLTIHPSDGISTAPDAVLEVPLMLVPLREGWITYPIVDIRETASSGLAGAPVEGDSNSGASATAATGGGSLIEIDFKNLGQVLRVVSDRGKVTFSLNSSGPGGGPLVLESERMLNDRIVA
ncbi:Trafficking protein particle complex II-specificsubunit 130 -like protein [Ceratocystis lukuohia]|uniref:Trafficking protein particle complex II-specificsubunit 130 -like protein n=1 Tax=Ceratocystis lukuohia TaxID=2019550 RepID=A0ABR4MCZ0_9PEZI